MTGVDTIVTKADIMEEEIATTETAEGQLTTIIPIILLVDIVVGALLHIHVVVVLLQTLFSVVDGIRNIHRHFSIPDLQTSKYRVFCLVVVINLKLAF